MLPHGLVGVRKRMSLGLLRMNAELMATVAMPLAALMDAFAPADPAPKPSPQPEPETLPEPEPEAKAEPQPEPQSEAAVHAAPEPVPPPAGEPAGPSLEDRVAKLETRPADAWLERRLRVFEHTLTELQGRQEHVEKNSSGAAGLLEQTVAELKQLIADADQRQREAMKTLRAAVVGVSSRMEGMESAIRAGRPIDDFVPEPLAEPEPAKSIESGTGARAEPQAGNVSFIAAARTAARVAAEQPAATPAGGIQLPRLLRKLTRTHLLIAGGVALIVLFATLGMVLSKTMARASASEAPQALAQLNRAAAPRDSAQVDFAVATKYLLGHGVPRDARMAAYWFGRAAQHGDARAAAELGAMFRHGLGVKADAAKSLRWYAIAAEGGNRKAMYDLASAYAEGWGTPRNLAQAAGWYARAAQEGDVDSAFNLAVLYERGDGVPQSLTAAFAWYAVAASEGDGQSAARVSALQTQLNPDQLSNARRFAQTFKPDPMDPAANAAGDQLARN